MLAFSRIIWQMCSAEPHHELNVFWKAGRAMRCSVYLHTKGKRASSAICGHSE